MKIAVMTTFPNNQYQIYGRKFVESFCKYWPKDIPLYIQLDAQHESQALIPDISEIGNQERPLMVSCEWGQEQAEFIKRNLEKEDQKDYRKQAIRFSHKVFALCAIANLETQFDYIIWIDADVETKKEITHEAIEKWLPKDETATYLGRKDWNCSETGFLIFNMKKDGKEFITKWTEKYITDKIFDYPEQTDAYAFDLLRSEFNENHTFKNLTEGLPGRDIFDVSPLAEFMEHHKGPKKKSKLAQSQQLHGDTVDLTKLKIQTKNCVDHEVITRNVSMNLRIIPHDSWFNPILPHKEEVIICSAGPSLSVTDILPWYRKGVKIVAVKHAVSTLQKAGIKPWAVVLLDPRPHVGEFVEYIDQDTLYFVSSMVDPSVTQHLKNCNAKMIGYHAAVGAGEEERIPQGHFVIQGGSATATRGISILRGLGFRKMHLYAYDCCYLKKPDLNDRKDNGRLRYEEVTLAEYGWNNERVVRTFWTEGQFLAQSQEFRNIYLPMKEIEFHTYGDGIIPWAHRYAQINAKWHEWLKEKEESKCLGTLAEFLN